LRHAKTPPILTPHPGEMARLIGKETSAVNANRIEVARSFAVAHHCHVILKGARTVIARVFGCITELRRKPVLPKPAHGPLDAIPLIGFHLVDAIQTGKVAVRGAVAALTASGARFIDGVEEPFDDVILATGFTAALAPLGNLVRTDAKGFAVRTDRVTSADQPHLYFVGHSYDATGGLYNIKLDSALAAERIAASTRRDAA